MTIDGQPADGLTLDEALRALARALGARGVLRDWWRLYGAATGAGPDERACVALGWATGAPPIGAGDPEAADLAVRAASRHALNCPHWQRTVGRLPLGRVDAQVLAAVLALQCNREVLRIARRVDEAGLTVDLLSRWVAGRVAAERGASAGGSGGPPPGQTPGHGSTRGAAEDGTPSARRPLLDATDPSRAAVRAALAPQGALRRWGLLRPSERPREGLLGLTLAVPLEVEALICGEPAVADQPAALDPQRGWVSWPGQAEVLAALAARIPPESAPADPVLLIGEPGSGRLSAIREMSRRVAHACWETQVAPEEAEVPSRLRAGCRDAALRGRVWVVRLVGPVTAQRSRELAGALGAVPRAPAAVLVSQSDAAALLAAVPSLVPLSWPAPDLMGRVGLVQQLAERRDWRVDEEDALALADAYRLSPRALARSVSDLGQGGGRRLDPHRFDACVRQRVRSRLGDLADPIEATQPWDALVIESSQRAVVDEIIAHARHRGRVLREWGFAARFGERQGLACLFSGPPGTGKTLTAGLIAQALGLAAYRVDLARVVDKYVGETEKNLARLFDEADRVPVVLLFDEADALFSQRTQGQTSQDRYANLEINYLLQRMERFGGISILTTNRASVIDPAFRRRLRFHVHFDLPDVADRERLWRRMLPAGCLLGPVDFERLARRWAISGALIRKAVLRGAFLAADRGVALDGELLEEATRAELAEAGRLASAS